MDTAKLLIHNGAEVPRWFAKVASEPGAVWLDSGMQFGDRGRFSLLARRPNMDVEVAGDEVIIRQPGRPERTLRGVDGLEVVQSLWSGTDCFSVGYISYEGALPFIAPELKNEETAIPRIRFAFYDSVLRFDHRENRLEVAGGGAEDFGDLTGVSVGDTAQEYEQPVAEVIQTLPRRDYCRCVAGIKEHIREGDIYQANFTTRIDVASAAEPFGVYRRLRELSPAPYSAYLNYGDYRILSSSPERMFLLEEDRLTAGPIKGTIARGRDEEEDSLNVRRLLASEKDRAELLMIVDLMRNDIGRVAEVGSVRVESLFRPEVYASVIHLVADVRARLRAGVGVGEVIRALLPGGSITGAPKKRAVEIIAAFERWPRSVYTGCIGYVYRGRADFNIAIRTMVHRNGVYHVHAGGGIVADSVPEQEYDEMRLKAARMLEALGLHKERMAWPG